MDSRRFSLAVGALFAGLGVAFGAFAAHGLRGSLDAVRLGWWQTAVDYQMWHGLALIALAALPLPQIGWPAGLIALGTAIFSGTLYAMALGAPRWLGAVTPIGGSLMIAGWVVLLVAALRRRTEPSR